MKLPTKAPMMKGGAVKRGKPVSMGKTERTKTGRLVGKK